MKIYLIGESCVGKTQLFNYLKASKRGGGRHTRTGPSSSGTQGSTTSSDFYDAEGGENSALETFQSVYIPTLSFTYSVDCGNNVFLDISGSANYATLTNTLIKTIFVKYFEGDTSARCGILLLFDLTNRNSLNNALSIWFKMVKGGSDVVKNLQHLEHIKRCTLLVGCKLDLEAGRHARVVSDVEHRKMADKHGLQYARVSAKTGEGLEALDIFFSSLERVYQEKEWAEDSRRRGSAASLLSCVTCALEDQETQTQRQPYSSSHINNNSKLNPVNSYLSRRRKEDACVAM